MFVQTAEYNSFLNDVIFVLTHPKVTLPLSGRLEKGEGEEHKCASHCSVFTPNSVVKSKNVHHLFYIKG